MNIHIELVKKWLNDPTSVTKAEREANKDAAYAAYDDAYGTDAYEAAIYAAYAANAADGLETADAAYYVKRYDELTKNKDT